MYKSRIHIDWLVNTFLGKKLRIFCRCCYVLSKNKIINGSMLAPINTVVQRLKGETSSFGVFSIQIHLQKKKRTILQKCGLRRKKTCPWGFTNNKGTDQPAHPRRLISAFVIRVLESIISDLATSEFSSFQLVWVAEETGLSLILSDTPKTGFVASSPNNSVCVTHMKLKVLCTCRSRVLHTFQKVLAYQKGTAVLAHQEH